ncbi:helix-turn-helix domain-containing protein [Bradyrhizobium lablabi]|uniref:helix-turn-helix domain-containing protein n=1 Tax=Bradyrhizobium lablabi TaxID=722472 RepID=UPI001BADF191|nr:helix-turn-helix domain-containing protein [Bradyrhizobium lablabi]MBR0695966.1 helix-turn-helix domain-containing protein [Bradyrhizobium lablabi]
MTTAKRRPRRIAADEAHSWARNLRLRNVSAKAVLTNLTLYVDGEGFCWVGIPSLAEDLEMSADTIRRRLSWLEEIGAILRQPQWIDEYGNRNSDSRGRRTTDKIRLLFEADIDAIEARAAGRAVADEREANSTPSDPSNLRGSDDDADPGNLRGSDPRLGLGRPSQSCEGLISEPEPELPPKSPSGGLPGDRKQVEEAEPEEFGPTFDAYVGHEVMRRDRRSRNSGCCRRTSAPGVATRCRSAWRNCASSSSAGR